MTVPVPRPDHDDGGAPGGAAPTPTNGDGASVPAAGALDGTRPLPVTEPAAAEPVRTAFQGALRAVLVAVAVIGIGGVAVGWAVAGTPGLWGALIGWGAAVVFSATTVWAAAATAGSTPVTMGAVVMGSWLGKMLVLVLLLGAIKDLTFYSKPVLVVVLLLGAFTSAAVDYLVVRRARVPYVG